MGELRYITKHPKHEKWDRYNAYWRAFGQYTTSKKLPLPALYGDAQEYFMSTSEHSRDDIWFAVGIRPVSGCIAVNATFRPRTDPAFQNARLRIEHMPYKGWPLQLEWRPTEESEEPFHQVEIRCLADLYDEGEWPEQYRWLARHLLALRRAVGQGTDPVSDQMIMSRF